MPKAGRHASLLAGLSVTLASVALAGLLDDARSVLGRLTSSDLGRPAAESAVQQARTAAENTWSAARDRLNRDFNQAKSNLEEAHRLFEARTSTPRSQKIANKQAARDDQAQHLAKLEKDIAQHGKLTPAEKRELEAGRKTLSTLNRELEVLKAGDQKRDSSSSGPPPLDPAAKARAQAALTRADNLLRQATDALGQANSAGDRVRAQATANARTAVDKTIGDLQGRADSARRSLRILILPPGGERSATRRGKCKKPYPPFAEFDCDVPNPPASDDELRNAIRTANSVLSDAGNTGPTARAAWAVKMEYFVQEQTKAFEMVSNILKKLHDAQMEIIQNMK